MLIGTDGKEYDDQTFTAILFDDARMWTVLGPWTHVRVPPNFFMSSSGVYRPHVAYCEREEDAKLIAELLTANRNK